MNHEIFDVILNRRLTIIKKVLASKAKEYATHDRFHNFKQAANMDDETPERALKGMWKKHLVSVFDMIDNLDRGIVPTEKLIDEKIGDSINYLILLEGLLRERLSKSELNKEGYFNVL